MRLIALSTYGPNMGLNHRESYTINGYVHTAPIATYENRDADFLSHTTPLDVALNPWAVPEVSMPLGGYLLVCARVSDWIVSRQLCHKIVPSTLRVATSTESMRFMDRDIGVALLGGKNIVPCKDVESGGLASLFTAIQVPNLYYHMKKRRGSVNEEESCIIAGSLSTTSRSIFWAVLNDFGWCFYDSWLIVPEINTHIASFMPAPYFVVVELEIVEAE